MFSQEKKYKKVRQSNTGVPDNNRMKISVLLAGTDIRNVLKITTTQIRDLNDNIRMVSCIGKNINI
jgi:hypothetical protein